MAVAITLRASSMNDIACWRMRNRPWGCAEQHDGAANARSGRRASPGQDSDVQARMRMHLVPDNGGPAGFPWLNNVIHQLSEVEEQAAVDAHLGIADRAVAR